MLSEQEVDDHSGKKKESTCYELRTFKPLCRIRVGRTCVEEPPSDHVGVDHVEDYSCRDYREGHPAFSL